jgi:hypothetical protein
MVQGSHFYATPGKQRWAARWVWRQENAFLLILFITAHKE